MSRSIPNVDQTGNDLSLSPVEVTASVVIVDNGTDCLWYPSVMDPVTADRFAFSLTRNTSTDAFKVDIKIILPSASELRSEVAELEQLLSDPVRANLFAG